MINTLKPAATPGHESTKTEVLKRIQQEYGAPEDKGRDPIKRLGKDEFFKIMVTQMQHQDPLKPYENEQMAAQMAQFSALEQMMNVNNNLEKLSQSQQPLHNLGATNLIGKHVTVDSSRIQHKDGKYSDIHFELPADAMKIRAGILNDRGEIIRDIEAFNLKKGVNKISWDGKGSNGLPAKSGSYTVQVSATNDRGVSIPVQSQKTEVVHGVSFEGNETVLLVGDVRSSKKVMLKDVSKIVDQQASDHTNKMFGGGAGVQMGIDPALFAGGSGQQPPATEQAASGESFDPIMPSDEQVVENYNPGLATKYTPFNVSAFHASQAKPEIPPTQSPSQAVAGAQDLSEANPVAQAIKAGKVIANDKEMPDVNPAAQKFLGANLPSSEDGSTVGKLGE